MPKSVARQSSRLAAASQAVGLQSALAKVVASRGGSRDAAAKRVGGMSSIRREETPSVAGSADKLERPGTIRPVSRWQAKDAPVKDVAAKGSVAKDAALKDPALRTATTSSAADSAVSRPQTAKAVSPARVVGTAAAATFPVKVSAKADPTGKTIAAASPLASLADDALLQRIRGDDALAGDTLIRRYAQPLLRYLQRLVGDDLAEELHQQTWVSVLDNLDKFDPTVATHNSGSGGFKAWLFRIATNKANDLWRSKGRERAAKEGLRLVSGQDTPWAGHKAEGREMEDKLIRAIGRLPESQRQVLALRYYSNMKFIDIAALLGCPLNTALGRVHKAMIKLRQLMDD